MGLSRKQKNVTFLSLSDGKMTKRVAEPTEYSEARKITKGKNEGQIVHEEKFDSLSGFITSVKIIDKQVSFQKEPFTTCVVMMQDGDDLFKIEWPLGSSYSRSFLTRLENVDFDKEVEFSTYWIEGDDEKWRGYVGLKQDGQKIEPLYEKKDLPEVEKVKVGNKLVYNDEKLIEFYRALVGNVSTQLEAANASSSEDVNEESDDDYSGDTEAETASSEEIEGAPVKKKPF